MEVKKKIFFLLYSMNVGGVEKSLVNLLSALPREKYDIHVGLVRQEGSLLSYLPSDVTIHHISDIQEHWDELKNPPLQSIKSYIQTGRLIKAISALIVYLICKIQGSFGGWTQYVFKDTKGLEETFDLAVAYAGPTSDIDYYICKKVQAKKKIGWIHFDIDKVGRDSKLINKLYCNYEQIVAVSDSCRMKFINTFPQLEEKTIVYNNVVSPNLILSQAEGADTFEINTYSKKILTVGRISREKGQIVAIDALRILVDKGYDVVWYFIGDGNDRKACEHKALNLGVKERAVFLGTQTNPYGYMRDCDVYVQPSRYEGYCVTILEALCFNSPIVATNFTSIHEQLKERQNGFVVGMSAEEIADGIEKALLAPKISISDSFVNSDVQRLVQLF